MNREVHGGTLVAGLVFILLGFTFLLEELGVWTLGWLTLSILGPALLILVGLAVLLAGAITGQRRRSPDAPGTGRPGETSGPGGS